MTQQEIIEKFLTRVSYSDGCFTWVDPGGRKDLIGLTCGAVSSSDGYVYIKFMQKRFLAHRAVFVLHHGFYPDEIDHINRVRSDNRIENLRDATSHSYNLGNQSKQSRGKTSIYKGVCWDKNRGKWMAGIKFEGKRYNLGRFSSELDAAIAYDEASVRIFGEYSHNNKS